MPVKQTNDVELLVETAKNACVILKYHTDECGEPCLKLVPVYENLSDNPKYHDIVFLRINADNNPVAKNFIINKRAPIVTIYHNGRLLESRTADNEEEMIQMLDMLLNERAKL
ncbi:thioredoxin family protein [Adhaeribacter terreus]|uniref:Thioredoxin family protein n=1 Tax=Adhaeribacter terreus TaxID=529703 RepID=A0ABW0EEK4_9BACT